VRPFLTGRGLFRALALVAVAAGLVAAPAPASAAQVTCQDMYFPTTLAGLLPEKVYGQLCTPPGATTVEVLIPGGTYNSGYWDIGYEPDVHSFRLAMNGAGIATLAMDRLGTGRSSKPLSTLVTATAQADAAHDVIRALRSGTLGPKFARIIVGGHSIGSAMALIEAGTFHDVDGVLDTGMTHRMNFTTVAGAMANMVPAPLDPQLAYRGLDAGYLTTKAGTRYDAFHTPGVYDTGAIAYDEATKGVFAATESVDTIAMTSEVTPVSQRITAPVLIVTGDDPNFCGPPLGSDCTSGDTLRASEAPYFPKTPSLRAFVLHGYGHAINYAPNAPTYFQVVEDWVAGL
jgi:hypothetical protein